ncbi:MAG TPA: MinD/ParA family protein [Deltaproteobacteria bacterium]|nr:MinD/ParA family protein [Deltaproteobacteria bacterium]
MVNKSAARIKKENPARRQTSGRPPRVISVTSGKGGVGKTNIVGNLAMALTRLGHRVLVMDADLGLANIDIIFGVHPTHNIGHVINGEKSLSEIIMEGPQGIRIIPAGSGFVNLTRLSEGQKLSLLSEFEALDDVLDFLLIDTSAGISENVLYFNLAADDCIIIATSEPTSITDAYAMMKVMALEYGMKHFKLLVNMVADEREAKSVYMNLSQASDRFLNGVVIEYVGYIPSDEYVKKAVRKRKPVLELYPSTAASKHITKLAKSMLEWSRRTDTDGNLKFFLKRYIEYRAVG